MLRIAIAGQAGNDSLMRNRIEVALLGVAVVAASANAQAFGVSSALSYSAEQYSGAASPSGQPSARRALDFGVDSRFKISSYVGVQLEAWFRNRGNDDYAVRFAEFPGLIRFALPRENGRTELFTLVGGSAAIRVSSPNPDGAIPPQPVPRIDGSYCLGVGVQRVMSGRAWSLEGRRSYGLVNLDTFPDFRRVSVVHSVSLRVGLNRQRKG